MNLEDKNLSLQFYNYLCNIVGSEEVVRTRREIFDAKDISENTTDATFISSGSKAEGLDLEGSDYDRMLQWRFIRVYESLNNVDSDPDKLQVVMETIDTKPGFTKLRLVDKSFLDSIPDLCETVGEETYISSERVREKALPDGMVYHGPCRSTPEGDYDQAICFRCTEWITPAQQWIHRSRTAWPDYTLPTSAVEYGVLFVPIGCKSSPYEDLQWRVSFSVTEKLLIHSFSHTQLLCYALLKIILKDIVKPKHKDLLCSYFIKTIMFWLSEEISPSEWKPENMIRCFLDCIIRLVYCVEYKTCPHYFIPDINLFEDRFTDNEHTALLDTLRLIYGSPWISVFFTTTFMNYILQSVTSHWMPLSASALSCFTYIRVGSNPCSIYRVFTRFENDLHSMLKKNICAIIQGVCARKSVQSSDLNNLSDKNKSLYKKYTKIFDLFKLSLQTDSVSSWLLLASLFYKYKRFHECLDIINYCLFSCTPEKAYLHYTNSLAEQTEFKQMTHTLGLLLAFKYWIIENTCFHYPFCLLPIELKSLISEKHRELYIPPVVYSYLLQFLCCHHLGDNKEKNKALHNLELTISEKFLIFHSEEMLRISHKSLQIVRTLIL